MPETKQRTQILLEPGQHAELTRLAREEGRSLSAVVREAVAEYLADRRERDLLQERLRNLEEIREFVEAVRARRGGRNVEPDVTDVINEQREERVRELTRGLIEDRDDADKGPDRR